MTEKKKKAVLLLECNGVEKRMMVEVGAVKEIIDWGLFTGSRYPSDGWGHHKPLSLDIINASPHQTPYTGPQKYSRKRNSLLPDQPECVASMQGSLSNGDTRCSYDLVLVIYHKRVWPHRLAYSLHELTIALLSVPS